MSDVVIKVENLYKEYRLGTISHGTLHRDLQSWWARMRGKEDPNSIISTVQPSKGIPTQPSTFNSQHSSDNPHFLALNDVSFEVKRGEVLGIIGRNGAGKSTLLKVLSEVTAPTSGTVKIKGRVASLLEVGTGFHPELTGRENIYLNGAILGMTKKEIDKKFDEIVGFAEVEKFIDTPVKRYSSGMYVRLAFAVAAHLEPEILIIDEVLAVGDAQFQKKCLGKMGEVSKEGRTVLFVSHNMGAIRNLCQRAMIIEQGKLAFDGETSMAIDQYFDTKQRGAAIIYKNELQKRVSEYNPTKIIYFECNEISLLNRNGLSVNEFRSDEEIIVSIKYNCFRSIPKIEIVVLITNKENLTIVRSESLDEIVSDENCSSLQPGVYESRCVFQPNMFGEHQFFLTVVLIYHGEQHLAFQQILSFKINFFGFNHSKTHISSKIDGYIRPKSFWQTSKIR